MKISLLLMVNFYILDIIAYEMSHNIQKIS